MDSNIHIKLKKKKESGVGNGIIETNSLFTYIK